MHKLLVPALALLVLGCRSPSTEDWIQQLQDSEAVKRRQAVRELALRTSDSDQVIAALVTALGDENTYVRHDAAVALGKFGAEGQAAVTPLVKALTDKDASVRRVAGIALKKIDPQAAKKAGVK